MRPHDNREIDMKTASIILAALGCMAVALPAMTTSASAYTVTRTVHGHHGVFGHGCRTVRTVVRGPHGKRVIVRKVCR
jgi:ribosomal protein S11